MGVVSVNQAVDGSTAVNAASLNTNFNTLANVINGNLDANNLAAGAVTLPKMATGVLASSNFSVPYKFRVYRNAAFSTTGGSYVLLPFDTKTFDTGTNIDVVTNKGRFTAPIAGFYSFNALVQATSNTYLQLALYKNGSLLSYGLNSSGSGVNQGSMVNDLVQLSASDYIEVYVASNTSTALFVAANNVYFSGFLVSAT